MSKEEKGSLCSSLKRKRGVKNFQVKILATNRRSPYEILTWTCKDSRQVQLQTANHKQARNHKPCWRFEEPQPHHDNLPSSMLAMLRCSDLQAATLIRDQLRKWAKKGLQNLSIPFKTPKVILKIHLFLKRAVSTKTTICRSMEKWKAPKIQVNWKSRTQERR